MFKKILLVSSLFLINVNASESATQSSSFGKLSKSKQDLLRNAISRSEVKKAMSKNVTQKSPSESSESSCEPEYIIQNEPEQIDPIEEYNAKRKAIKNLYNDLDEILSEATSKEINNIHSQILNKLDMTEGFRLKFKAWKLKNTEAQIAKLVNKIKENKIELEKIASMRPWSNTNDFYEFKKELHQRLMNENEDARAEILELQKIQ